MPDSPKPRAPRQSQSHSILACYPCRKRKIKCGRELFECAICKQTSQTCIYPARSERPGPKIGSTHARSSRPQSTRRNDVGHRKNRSQDVPSPILLPNQPESLVGDSSTPNSSSQSGSTQSPPRGNQTTSLSFILHPSFDTCSPEPSESSPPRNENDSIYDESLQVTCRALGMTLTQLNRLIARFFDVFTSFRLFHIPTWQTKLRQIPTTSQRTALLAAMLAWAVKGLDNDGLNQLVEGLDLKSSPDEPSIHFRAISLKHMDEAITECWDEPLSLPLLQTMIMNTQCLLVQGVRGRAWRYLGVCVRSAYEMNLHLIDAEERRNCDGSHLFDAERWCREEEWRRAWWAMWEMDIYASVIRRCPAAIDWSQNETFLPAEDDNWYSAKPQQSCRLDINPTSRWKCLAATNNRSPKAWFIVINSLMKDAQKISSPVSIDQGASATLAQDSMRSSSPVADSACPKAKKQQHSINRLNIILNSLHCTLLALPKELKYTGQHLEFTPNYRLSPDAGGRNLRASSIYSIYVMAQLTKLMAIKYHIFRTGWEWTIPLLSTSSDNDFYGPSDPSQTTAEENERRSIASPEYRYLGQYFEAADNVIHIIRATSEDHHQCVNPFLASTIWLAGALQLVRSDMAASDSSEKDLYTSNFEMVSLIYQKFVDFWGMSKIPLKHWATLGSGLKEIRRSLGQGHNLRYETPCLFAGGISAHRPTLRPSSKEYILATTSTSPPSNIYPLEVTDHLGSKDRPGQAPWGLSSASNTQAYSIENQTTSFEPDTTVSVDMTSNNTLAYQNPASETRLEYDFPSLWGQPNHHDRQPLCNEISSTGLPDPEQDSIPGGSAGQNLSLPDNLDSMPYGYDWAISTNFSTYLDEILSGSYLP